MSDRFVPRAGTVNFALSVISLVIVSLQSGPQKMLREIFSGLGELAMVAIGLGAFFYTIYAVFRHKDSSRDMEAVLFIWMVLCNAVAAVACFAYIMESGLTLFFFIPIINVVLALVYIVDLVRDEPAELGEISWSASLQASVGAGVITIVSLMFIWAGVPWPISFCLAIAYASFGHAQLIVPHPKD